MFGRRRRLLIDRRQLTLLGINLLYMSIVVLVFCVILFAPVAFVFYDSSATFEQQDQAADHLLLLHKTVWPAVLLVFGLFVGHSVVYSHRIIGPLYRFRLVFDKVLDGDLTMRANLRTKDHLHLEAKMINAMLDSVVGRIEHLAVQGAAARASLAHVRSLAARDGLEELAVAIESLAARIDSLNEGLDAFALPGGEATARPAATEMTPDAQTASRIPGEPRVAAPSEPARSATPVAAGAPDAAADRGPAGAPRPAPPPHERFELQEPVEPADSDERSDERTAASTRPAPSPPERKASSPARGPDAARTGRSPHETVIVKRGTTEEAVDRALDSLIGVGFRSDD